MVRQAHQPIINQWAGRNVPKLKYCVDSDPTLRSLDFNTLSFFSTDDETQK